MIDINREVEKSLADIDCKVEYYYPSKFNKLPVVSFYTVSESPDLVQDNEESIQKGTVVVDVWADEPIICGTTSVKVNEVMNADGWVREFSRDIPPEGDVFHKTMRFSKIFNL